MKAIFIWKSETPISTTSHKMKFIRGATWWLEETESKNKSYEIIKFNLTENGIIYLVEEKPIDWTGEDYLETVEVNYSKNKEIEQIGIWSRYISGKDVSGLDEALALAQTLVKEKILPGFSSGKKE
jgi:hypothetical protein